MGSTRRLQSLAKLGNAQQGLANIGKARTSLRQLGQAEEGSAMFSKYKQISTKLKKAYKSLRHFRGASLIRAGKNLA